MANALAVNTPPPSIITTASMIKLTSPLHLTPDSSVNSPAQVVGNQQQLALVTLKQGLERQLAVAFNEELISIETYPQKVIIRLNDKAPFASDSIPLKTNFILVFRQI